MTDKLEKVASLVSCMRGYCTKTAAREKVSVEYLKNSENRSATALLMAVRNLLGVGVLAWEPETIWLTLERDYGIETSEEARNKVQAAITLVVNPAFYYDNLVFQRTVQALNGEPFDPEALQECHPAHMNWAAYEAKIIRGHDPEDEEDGVQQEMEFDEDVQQYIAVCLKRAGYAYPPPQLLQTADNLAKMLPEDSKAFIADVKKRWEHLDKEALTDRQYLEDPLGVQLAQLAACVVYATERAKSLGEDVLVLDQEIVD